jgi:PKD repeat protein
MVPELLCQYMVRKKQPLKSMRTWTFLLILLALFVCTQPVLAADPFATQKTAYIGSHPGQSLIPYPWDPVTSTRVLPFNYVIPAAPANNFSLAACPDEFESGSFIITSQKAVSGIGISVPDLKDDRGNTIPSSAIDARIVKVWYQASPNDIWLTQNQYILTPELLLKDDSLVKVDYVNKVNYLKVTINSAQQYIDISTPTATIPTSAQVNDAATLQPFSMSANENKQIWLTVHVPASTPAGDYRGNITLTVPSDAPVLLAFTVTVLPFSLEKAPLEYSLYYRGRLTTTPPVGINSEFKTSAQYSIELQDMKNHGVLYPVLYQGNDQMLGTALSLRKQSGLPTDHIYVVSMETGNPTTQAGLTALATQVKKWKNITAQYGYSDLYIYGMDEATGSTLQSERLAWQTAKQNGAKIFVAGSTDAADIVGDLLNVAVIAGALNTSQASKWHSYGQKLFSYANPQVGIENAELYRKNYGFALWNAGYDGEMNYAYQHSYGNIWNDFDDVSSHYRDHVFAYPASNGVIDTIQWEGFREGVDDTRYLATLKKKEGNDVSAKAIVSSSLSSANSMTSIRQKVIARILSGAPAVPAAGFTGTPVTGTTPLKVQFTDTSTNAPTSWSWSFGDGSTVNATVKNPLHTYTAAGTYTVTLTAKNAAGSTVTTRTKYITVTAAPTAPVAGFTGTPVSGTSPLKVQFTDTSTNAPTSWSWSFGDGSTVNATVKNPLHTYTTAGTYTVTLTAKNAAGSGKVTKTGYIKVTSAVSPPTAQFTGNITSGKAPLAVQFTITSISARSDITSGTWDVNNDGKIESTIRNPLYTYQNPGNYTVKLTLTNTDGTGTIVKTNYIKVVPPA